MITEERRKIRATRASDRLWRAYGAACAKDGKDRSEVTRQFWAWYSRLPGAQLPIPSHPIP